jgi:SAM-dependent methyltransferase
VSDAVRDFYDSLAADYDLIYGDWSSAVRGQGEVLDVLIRQLTGRERSSVLDCTCGVGTQAIGLALRGHRVHGTDISPAAIERARAEAEALGVDATFAVADVRTLDGVEGTFDAVISCDNSLPHLLTDDDLDAAFRSIHGKLTPAGVFLASIRDYDALLHSHPGATTPRVHAGRIVFQVWDWQPDGRTYTLHHFLLVEGDGAWETRHRSAPYRALRRGELSRALERAGYADVTWRVPADTGFFQPIVTAAAGNG